MAFSASGLAGEQRRRQLESCGEASESVCSGAGHVVGVGTFIHVTSQDELRSQSMDSEVSLQDLNPASPRTSLTKMRLYTSYFIRCLSFSCIKWNDITPAPLSEGWADPVSSCI